MLVLLNEIYSLIRHIQTYSASVTVPYIWKEKLLYQNFKLVDLTATINFLDFI